MKLVASVPVFALVFLGGCSSGGPLLNETKQIGPRQEWVREVVSPDGGDFTFEVTSKGPFAVRVMTEKGNPASKANEKTSVGGGSILLTIRSQGPTHEGRVSLPAGSSSFIIENLTDKTVDIQLRCFPVK